MRERELRDRLNSLQRAYERLKEVLAVDPKENEIALDAAIQRFEFTFELSWKTVKRFAEFFNAGECNSGRSCIKLAYRLGWIDDEEKWLSLLEARNLTSHTYNEGIAWEVYETVRSEHPVFEKLILSLKAELEKLERGEG